VEIEGVWTLLHLFFAFGFVGALVLADWNSCAAQFAICPPAVRRIEEIARSAAGGGTARAGIRR
jgi:hypothetical protein